MQERRLLYMNKIPNRQAICEVLMEQVQTDKDIVVLCSDSRGSASMTPFADTYPDNCRTEISQHFRRSCKMRQEAVCSITGMFPFYKKLRAGEGRLCLFEYQCNVDWYQRWYQLWCAWHEPSFCAGYCSNVRNSEYACISSE